MFSNIDSQALGNTSEAEIYTPMAASTDSAEVLQLARHWLNTCLGPGHQTCPSETSDYERRYPTRLIELPPYDMKVPAPGDWKARLVITKGHAIQPIQTKLQRADTLAQYDSDDEDEQMLSSTPRGHYVTLSHCWGKREFERLTKQNMSELQFGIELDKLPTVFRQAIDFARRLRKDIRYIWIDALCIVQDSGRDWRDESVRMYEVYRNSFCNISATAAGDSSQSMHPSRNPEHLWEDEVNVNTEGIPLPLQEVAEKKMLGNEPRIVRCHVQDASSWDRLVDYAPVNQRAWVLQERLLAPRVLHFCGNQVAWECRHLDATESLPHGVSSLNIKSGSIVQRESWKRSLPQEHGTMSTIRDTERLSLQAHECWKRLVERYSTTSLTKHEDRLIALAGIAQLVSKQIGKKVLYVAGLWEKHLASQLLWRVNQSYDDGTPVYPQQRPKVPSEAMRVPTFSWVAVEASQGIRCGKTIREDEMYISVDTVHLPEGTHSRRERFGSIKPGCFLQVHCRLQPIQILRTQDKKAEGAIRYRWRLLDERVAKDKEYSNLYLDCPRDDRVEDSPEGQVFCMPAHKDTEGYMTCLVLHLVEQMPSTYPRLPQLQKLAKFRRVGLLIIPPYDMSASAKTSIKGAGPSLESLLLDGSSASTLQKAGVSDLVHSSRNPGGDSGIPPDHAAAHEVTGVAMPFRGTGKVRIILI